LYTKGHGHLGPWFAPKLCNLCKTATPWTEQFTVMLGRLIGCLMDMSVADMRHELCSCSKLLLLAFMNSNSCHLQIAAKGTRVSSEPHSMNQ
jgi:hypothetical protein